MTTAHPKRLKCCAFCKRWEGDAKMQFVNKDVGFRFDANVRANCLVQRNNRAANQTCKDFAISVEADRIM